MKNKERKSGANVEVPIKLLSTISGDATFRVSRRQGGEIGREGAAERILWR